MYAVILAGGYATRLWPITRHRPKMLLPVGGQTVIDRILTQLEADDRIETVYLSTNERFAADFRSHLADSEYDKPQLSVEKSVEEEQKLGVVGALAQLVAREEIDDEDLLVVAGDNLISFDLSDFLDRFDEEGSSLIAAYDIGSWRKARQYGVVELDGEAVVDFQEKPDQPASSLVSVACYAFPAADSQFEAYLAGDNNPDEPGWFIQWLRKRRRIRAFTFEDAWFDIGSPDGYLDAISWKLNGDTVVAETATVENADLSGSVHIMDGATVTDATLERSIVFPEATVRSSTLCRSIVDCHGIVEQIDLADGLIGAHSQLPAGEPSR